MATQHMQNIISKLLFTYELFHSKVLARLVVGCASSIDLLDNPSEGSDISLLELFEGLATLMVTVEQAMQQPNHLQLEVMPALCAPCKQQEHLATQHNTPCARSAVETVSPIASGICLALMR